MSVNYCNDKGAVAFVKKNYPDCQKLGETIKVPPEYILGVAASETGYGRAGRFAQINNFFSMETKNDNPNIKYAIRYEVASATAKDKHPVKLAVYEDFYNSGLSFIDRWGKAISGAKTPEEFVNKLKNAGFNSGDPKTGGTATFVTDLIDVIKAVTARVKCPE